MAMNANLEQVVADLELPVDVKVKTNRTARRLVLSMGPCADQARLTVPPGISFRAVTNFLDARRGWLEERLAEAPVPVPFDPGARIPIEGHERVLRHSPDHRGTLSITVDEITVGGDVRHVRRRVRDGLVALSRKTLSARVTPFAEKVHKDVSRVSVRDTRSRWGSCSANGRLSFSWRLIFAPPEVLDYVAAHEVAHLVHRDHSDRFWHLVGELMPTYREPQRWLVTHGRGLHRFGATPVNAVAVD